MAIDAALGRLGIKPGVCTSSTRPANPFEGQVIYETDTNNIRFWSGSAWESNKGGLVSSSAPTGAAAGDIWYDSDDGRAYIYYDDGSSQQWVEFGAPPVQHGKILQVVSATKTDTFTSAVSSGGSANITGLSASVTPSATSSKILVMAIVNGTRITSDVPNIPIAVTRDGTLVGVGDTAGSRTPVGGIHFTFTSNGNSIGNAQVIFLDSPASASSLTYQVVLRGVANTTATFAVNRASSDTDTAGFPRSISTLTLMEVSA